MTVTLTGTGVKFDDNTTQITSAGADYLGSTNVTNGATYVTFDGFFNAGYRNRYGSLLLTLESFSPDTPNDTLRDLFLQFRWTDGKGAYGWATTSSTPYRYPVLNARIRNLRNDDNNRSYSDYTSFGDSAITVARGHWSYSGTINILEINGFACTALYNGYGTDDGGHNYTWGGGKVENRTDPPSTRHLDGLRLFWSNGALHKKGRMTLQGIKG